MKVEFSNFYKLNEGLEDLYTEAFNNFLKDGRYINGPKVSEFEESFALFSKHKHNIGVSSGLDALEIALRAINVGPGDEVIVPSNTYIATWLAVSSVGATVVPIEPNMHTHLVEVESVTDLVTEKTRAVILVHLYGKRCNVAAWRNALSSDISIIDDCAQSHGAAIEAREQVADVSCWSFYPGKNLGALGDAGAISTDNSAIADYCRTYRNYGSKEKYVNDVVGSNRRLDELQATFLNLKLTRLNADVVHRRNVARKYLESVRNEHIKLPMSQTMDHDAWHLFVLQSEYRNKLQMYLEANGIGTLIHYPIPPHKQLAYKNFNNRRLPVAESLAARVLSIPCNSYISEIEQDYIIDVLNKFRIH